MQKSAIGLAFLQKLPNIAHPLFANISAIELSDAATPDELVKVHRCTFWTVINWSSTGPVGDSFCFC